MTDDLDVHRLVAELQRLLLVEYVFPDVAEQICAVLEERLRAAAYDDVRDVMAFADVLTQDLLSVNGDRHLRVLYSAEEVESESDPEGQFAALVRWAGATGGGVARVERLESNMAYLDLRPILFPPPVAGEQITAAMTLVSDAEVLIIDLRQCLGGDPSTVQFICSYLFGDDPVHLIDIYERRGDRTNQHWTQPFVPGRKFGPTKPLYVLTSKQTFSGAEELAYDLQRLKRAVIVGEQTGGGAHPREGFKLHRHLEATIPIARSADPDTGANWEGTGVIPDIPSASADALTAAVRDAKGTSASAGHQA